MDFEAPSRHLAAEVEAMFAAQLASGWQLQAPQFTKMCSKQIMSVCTKNPTKDLLGVSPQLGLIVSQKVIQHNFCAELLAAIIREHHHESGYHDNKFSSQSQLSDRHNGGLHGLCLKCPVRGSHR